MRTETAKKINGFPNRFWGWGGEDDIFAHRVMQNGLTVRRPMDGCALQDLEARTLNEKLAVLRDLQQKCADKWERKARYMDGAWSDGMNECMRFVEGLSLSRIAPGVLHCQVAVSGRALTQ